MKNTKGKNIVTYFVTISLAVIGVLLILTGIKIVKTPSDSIQGFAIIGCGIVTEIITVGFFLYNLKVSNGANIDRSAEPTPQLPTVNQSSTNEYAKSGPASGTTNGGVRNSSTRVSSSGRRH